MGAPGIQIVAKMRPRSRPVRACPGTDAPDGPFTIDAMPLAIHTQNPGPFLRNGRRSIRTYLADHHYKGRQPNDRP